MNEIKLVATTKGEIHNHLNKIWQTIKPIEVDKPLEVIVRPFKRRRSNPQNARLWVIHTQAALFISTNTGNQWTAEDLHCWFKDMFCGLDSCELNGRKVFKAKSSTDLNTEDMAEAQEKWCAYLQTDLGIPLDLDK